MAEVTENTAMTMDSTSKFASKSQNAASLSLGIIGTALGVIGLGMGGGALFGGNRPGSRQSTTNDVQDWILRNERKNSEDILALEKQRYEDKIQLTSTLTDEFFKLYQQNVDNSWQLYKNHIDDSFALYKQEHADKDELQAKIDAVDKKVDVMAAIRPYQDALINAKIDNVALVGDFNLAKRTCRMIQGELVLPSSPEITGYPSYSYSTIYTPTSGSTY